MSSFNMFMVIWDDQMGLCVPMVWDTDCQGALCGWVRSSDQVAMFPTRKAARVAIDISTKWNALLKAQGNTYNEDFEGVNRKNRHWVSCSTALCLKNGRK